MSMLLFVSYQQIVPFNLYVSTNNSNRKGVSIIVISIKTVLQQLLRTTHVIRLCRSEIVIYFRDPKFGWFYKDIVSFYYSLLTVEKLGKLKISIHFAFSLLKKLK